MTLKMNSVEPNLRTNFGSVTPPRDAAGDAGEGLPPWLTAMAESLAEQTPMEYLAHHSHSFRYAARFLPAPYDERVAEVYAFCRFTDDLVDVATERDPAILRARLGEWRTLALRAHGGTPCGFALLDRPLLEMGRRGIPFDYAAELIEGVAMDLPAPVDAHEADTGVPSPRRYATLAELDLYSYRVASVVGLWLTRLVGVHDAAVLERAADLGHAMQLTNILRDVGEDWRNGRLYLPLDVLARHGVTEADIARAANGHALPRTWPQVVEELMASADRRYARSLDAVRALPTFFRTPVAVSGLVYRDIHTAIRKNGHNNLTRRAHTSKVRKLWLGVRARLWLAGVLPGGLAGRSRSGSDAPPSGRNGKPLIALVTSLCAGLVFASSPLTPAVSGSEGSKPQKVSASSQEGKPVEPLEARALTRARAELSRLDAALRNTPLDFELSLARLRILHLLSVHDETLLPVARRARAEAHKLVDGGVGSKTSLTKAEGAMRASLVLAYRGALDVVEARHAFWPNARLTPLRRGLPQLDTAVARLPDNPEIRYLRLTSTYYLPFFLGRSWSVREDFKSLATQLPTAHAQYPTDWYVALVDFVLDKGDLPEQEKRALRAARTAALSAGGSASAAASQPDYSGIP
jgi:phytoene synthase